MIKSLMRYLWKRDSESATCLIIDLMFTLDDHDVRDLRDMVIELHKQNQRPLQQ